MNDAPPHGRAPAAAPNHEHRFHQQPAWWLPSHRSNARTRAARASRRARRARPRSFAAASRAGAPLLEQLTPQALDAAREGPADRSERSRRLAHPRCACRSDATPPRLGSISSRRLTSTAIESLIDRQAQADREAGLDWTTSPAGKASSTSGFAARTSSGRSNLDDPGVWAYRTDQRRVLASRLGLPEAQADELSRWVLAHPDSSNPRICAAGESDPTAGSNSPTEHLETVATVERPVGLFLVPALKVWRRMAADRPHSRSR